VLTVGDVPHDWLFDKVAAVVHAAGAGLRAGVPAVTIPEPGGDQPFWARRLQRLGVSAATLSRRTLAADRLAAALAGSTYGERAKHLAAQLADEDGAGAAASAVERLLG
jgi:sterol 3beta-glucosyltransferase